MRGMSEVTARATWTLIEHCSNRVDVIHNQGRLPSQLGNNRVITILK